MNSIHMDKSLSFRHPSILVIVREFAWSISRTPPRWEGLGSPSPAWWGHLIRTPPCREGHGIAFPAGWGL